MKISQWKSLTGESRTDSMSLQLSHRGPTWTEFPSLSSHGRQHTVSAAGEAHSSLGAQGAYWDLVRSAWLTTCVPGLSLSPPGVKAPTINILLAETLWCNPRPPSKQDPVTWQEIPSLRVTSQLPGQSRAFLWARLTLYWSFYSCLDLQASESRNTINFPILLFLGICLAQRKKCLPLRPLPQTPVGRGPSKSAVELKGHGVRASSVGNGLAMTELVRMRRK